MSPVLRVVEPPALRQQPFQRLGLMLRTAGCAAVVARANALLGLVAVLAAIRLVRG